jgi:serine/threonine protein phosphatase 1
MRTLAIGDIHGCYTALTTLANFVPFSTDDQIVTLGDYLNRGPNSKGVLDWLIAWQARGRLLPLRGNHEVMTLWARDNQREFHSWLEIGGRQTLASYTKSKRADLSQIPDEHWAFLEATLPYYEIETHFFLHANAHPRLPLDKQSDLYLYWEKFDGRGPHVSGKIMVCGHTAQKQGHPRNVGHAVCIDTWAYGKGWLTCLDVATGHYWQANEKGNTRENWLSDP